jgi:hypothetical protein
VRRLAFIIAAAMVPAALLALLLVGYDYYERERAQLIRDSQSTTRALAVAVDTEFAVVKAALLALATSSRLSADDLAGFHAQALQAIQGQESFANIIVTDQDGRQLVNTFRRFGEPLPAGGDPGGLLRTFSTGAPVVSDLFKGRLTQSPIIGVGVPVKRDGRVRYSLNAGLTPGRFSALLKQQRLPGSWIAVVFDTSGTIVARTHDEARLVGQEASPELVRRSKHAREDAFDSRTVEGIPVLTVFSRAPMSGWTVAIGIPQRDLVLDLVYSLARLFVVGFIALVVAIVLAFLIARRVTRPPDAHA